MNTQVLIQSNMVVKHYAGSIAYGTNLPTSDVDFRGIFFANPISIRTPFFPVKEIVDDKEEDTKFYEMNHFMRLCLDCNPNILESLWVEENNIVRSTPAYNLLRKHRKAFLSSKIAFTTSGYAFAQLKRIKMADSSKFEFGYNTKHAMHLVRLLRMGIEALRDGEILIKRPDAEELLEIRHGAWKLEDIIKYAEKHDKAIREVWYKKTDLPKYPDIKLAANVLIEAQDLCWDQ